MSETRMRAYLEALKSDKLTCPVPMSDEFLLAMRLEKDEEGKYYIQLDFRPVRAGKSFACHLAPVLFDGRPIRRVDEFEFAGHIVECRARLPKAAHPRQSPAARG